MSGRAPSAAPGGPHASTPASPVLGAREREYKSKVDLLEAELLKAKGSASAVAEAEAEKHLSKLRELHGTIVSNIDQVQDQTARILQEQERDLLRAFRARLYDLHAELEKEKARAEDGAAVWIERNRQVAKELEWAKDMAERLDRHNQALARGACCTRLLNMSRLSVCRSFITHITCCTSFALAENTRLKNQYRTQEDDREYLIKQLVAAKKDNARLRSEMARSREEAASLASEVEELKISAAMGQHEEAAAAEAGGAGEGKEGDSPTLSVTQPRKGSVPGSRAQSAGAGAAEAEQLARQLEAEAAAGEAASMAAAAATSAAGGTVLSGAARDAEIARYRDTILRLKRVIDAERRAARGLRAQLTAELASRTDAEVFLRRAIEDAKLQVERKRRALMLAAVGPGPGYRRLAQGGSLSPVAGTTMPAAPAGAGVTASVRPHGNQHGGHGHGGHLRGEDSMSMSLTLADGSTAGGRGGGGGGAGGLDAGAAVMAGGDDGLPEDGGSIEDAGLVDAYSALPQEQREGILASLLAQEHVLAALQRITFPQRPPGSSAPASPAASLPASRRNSLTGTSASPARTEGSSMLGGGGSGLAGARAHSAAAGHSHAGTGHVGPTYWHGPDVQTHASGSAAGMGTATELSVSGHSAGIPVSAPVSIDLGSLSIGGGGAGGHGGAGGFTSTITAADSLAAAKQFAGDVQASARERVEAQFGREFDAKIAVRAAVRSGPGAAGGAAASSTPGGKAGLHIGASPKGTVGGGFSVGAGGTAAGGAAARSRPPGPATASGAGPTTPRSAAARAGAPSPIRPGSKQSVTRGAGGGGGGGGGKGGAVGPGMTLGGGAGSVVSDWTSDTDDTAKHASFRDAFAALQTRFPGKAGSAGGAAPAGAEGAAAGAGAPGGLRTTTLGKAASLVVGSGSASGAAGGR